MTQQQKDALLFGLAGIFSFVIWLLAALPSIRSGHMHP